MLVLIESTVSRILTFPPIITFLWKTLPPITKNAPPLFRSVAVSVANILIPPYEYNDAVEDVAKSVESISIPFTNVSWSVDMLSYYYIIIIK